MPIEFVGYELDGQQRRPIGGRLNPARNEHRCLQLGCATRRKKAGKEQLQSGLSEHQIGWSKAVI
jgi:hypothetical protein